MTAGSGVEIAHAARRLLSSGPMTQSALLASLRRERHVHGADLDLLSAATSPWVPGRVVRLGDGRLAHLPDLTTGMVLTTRLTAAEARGDALMIGTDLAPIADLTDHPPYDTLLDGLPLRPALQGEDDHELRTRGILDSFDDPDVPGRAWLLASGTFARLGLSASDLLAVTVTDRGLRLSRADAPTSESTVVGAYARRLGSARASLDDVHHGVGPEELVWHLRAEDPAAFTQALPPLEELLLAAGMHVLEGSVLPPGVSADDVLWSREDHARRLAVEAEAYGWGAVEDEENC